MVTRGTHHQEAAGQDIGANTIMRTSESVSMKQGE